MSYSQDIRLVAERIAALGPLSARLSRPAEVRPGQAGLPARIDITTSIPRPASVGGGVVRWSGYVDFVDREHVDKLNTLLHLLMELLGDVGPLLAAVRNAFEAADAARAAQRQAEEKLEQVLTGGPSLARGTFYIAVDAQGRAWLQDPVKRANGFGFRFPSLADLWRAHPELRPVRWGEDADGPFLIVETFAMEPTP